MATHLCPKRNLEDCEQSLLWSEEINLVLLVRATASLSSSLEKGAANHAQDMLQNLQCFLSHEGEDDEEIIKGPISSTMDQKDRLKHGGNEHIGWNFLLPTSLCPPMTVITLGIIIIGRERVTKKTQWESSEKNTFKTSTILLRER